MRGFPCLFCFAPCFCFHFVCVHTCGEGRHGHLPQSFSTLFFGTVSLTKSGAWLVSSELVRVPVSSSLFWDYKRQPSCQAFHTASVDRAEPHACTAGALLTHFFPCSQVPCFVIEMGYHCNPGWLSACCVDRDELLILLPLIPK